MGLEVAIMTKNEQKKFYIFSALGLFMTGLLFYKSLILSIILLAFIRPIRLYYEKILAEKRKSQLTVQFKDFLYSISASFATGRHMVSALQEAYSNLQLIYNEDDIIVVEIKSMCKRLIDNKESEEAVLTDFALRSGVEDIINFIDVYFTCRNTGGDIQKVINEAAVVISDRIDIAKEINTITAQKKYEARILTLIPLGLLAFLQLTSPEYIEPLYSTIQGRLIMTGAIGMIVVAFLWSMKITEIKV
jgi:tight adherence protein B